MVILKMCLHFYRSCCVTCHTKVKSTKQIGKTDHLGIYKKEVFLQRIAK